MNRRRLNNLSPIMIILILMVVRNFVNGRFSDPVQWLIDRAELLPGIIIGLSFHEFAHAFVADRLGDSTPRLQGRVTLNPLAHIDPMGFVALMLAGFGWGVPVQINPRNFKNRRRDEALVAIAGVTMNLLIALFFTLVLMVIVRSVGSGSWPWTKFGRVLVSIVSDIIIINIVLMFFNLLPVPPLDGFNLMTQILNLERYDWYPKVYQYGNIFLVLLILAGVTGMILTPLVNGVYTLLIRWALG